MSPARHPFDAGRARPIVTSLDPMRPRLDHDRFDAAILALPAVAADLGDGDIRVLPGSIAWIERLREEGKRIGVTAGAERAAVALELARIADRVDVAAARADGVELVIAVARGGDSPEQLRRAGATMVVADLQELLGVTSGSV